MPACSVEGRGLVGVSVERQILHREGTCRSRAHLGKKSKGTCHGHGRNFSAKPRCPSPTPCHSRKLHSPQSRQHSSGTQKHPDPGGLWIRPVTGYQLPASLTSCSTWQNGIGFVKHWRTSLLRPPPNSWRDRKRRLPQASGFRIKTSSNLAVLLRDRGVDNRYQPWAFRSVSAVARAPSDQAVGR